MFLVNLQVQKKVWESRHGVVMWAVKGSANEIWNVLFLDELTLPYFIPAEKRQMKPVELQQYFEVINTGTQNKAYQATIQKKKPTELNPLT